MGLRDQGCLGVRSPGSSSQMPTCCVALGQNFPTGGQDWACSGSRRWEPGCPESFGLEVPWVRACVLEPHPRVCIPALPPSGSFRSLISASVKWGHCQALEGNRWASDWGRGGGFKERTTYNSVDGWQTDKGQCSALTFLRVGAVSASSPGLKREDKGSLL